MPLDRMPSIKAGMQSLSHAAVQTRENLTNAANRTKETVSDFSWTLSDKLDKVNKWAHKSKIGKVFMFKERRTRLTSELRAGTITFLMVAYILAVNPQILGTTGGNCIPKDVCSPEGYDTLGPQCVYSETEIEAQDCLEELKLNLITATAASSCISCFLMGYFANLPLALAPGMGINAYVAYQVVGPLGQGGLSYSQAMTAIFVEGWIFILLSLTGIRGGIIKYMPANISFASSVGIGLLLAFTGLRNLGVVVLDPDTIVSLGGCTEEYQDHVFMSSLVTLPVPVVNSSEFTEGGVYGCRGGQMRSASMWLGISGGVITAILLAWHIKGALFIGIAYVTVISWIPGHAASYLGEGSVIPGGQKRLDTFKQVVAAPSLSQTGVAWDWSAFNSSHLWVALFTFLYIDLLDCTGTLLSMASLLDDVMAEDAEAEDGMPPAKPFLTHNKEFHGQMWAFLADGFGIITAAMTGVTPLTVYIESAAGIEDGGRTGLTAIVVSFFFFVSLFFSPILAAIPPYATGPALVLVGLYLIAHVDRISWDEPRQSVPAFLTIIIMPFTLSVAYGIIAGLGSFIILNFPGWAYEHCHRLYMTHIKRKYSTGEDSQPPSPSSTNGSGRFRARRRSGGGALPRKTFGTLQDLRRTSSYYGSDDGNHSVVSFVTDRSAALEAMERASMGAGVVVGSSPVAIRGGRGLRRSVSHAGIYDASGSYGDQEMVHMQGRSLAEYKGMMGTSLQKTSGGQGLNPSARSLRRSSTISNVSSHSYHGERSIRRSTPTTSAQPQAHRDLSRSSTYNDLTLNVESELAGGGGDRGGQFLRRKESAHGGNAFKQLFQEQTGSGGLFGGSGGSTGDFKLFGDVTLNLAPESDAVGVGAHASSAGSEFKLFGNVDLQPPLQQEEKKSEFKLFGDVDLGAPSTSNNAEADQEIEAAKPAFKLFGDVDLGAPSTSDTAQEQTVEKSEFKLFGDVELPPQPPEEKEEKSDREESLNQGLSQSSVQQKPPLPPYLPKDITSINNNTNPNSSRAGSGLAGHRTKSLADLFAAAEALVSGETEGLSSSHHNQSPFDSSGPRGSFSSSSTLVEPGGLTRALSGSRQGSGEVALTAPLPAAAPSSSSASASTSIDPGSEKQLQSKTQEQKQKQEQQQSMHMGRAETSGGTPAAAAGSSGGLELRISLSDGMGEETMSPFTAHGLNSQGSIEQQQQHATAAAGGGGSGLHVDLSSGSTSPSKFSGMTSSELAAAKRLKSIFSWNDVDSQIGGGSGGGSPPVEESDNKESTNG